MKYFLSTMIISLSIWANVVPCVDAASCSFKGVCDVPTGNCSCYDGHITPDNGAQCSYEQKNGQTAFLAQIIIGLFGGAELYAGHFGVASGQMILTLFSSGFLTIALKTEKHLTQQARIGIGAAGAVGMVAAVSWWIADIIRFMKNDIKDGNGYSLQST